MKELKQFFIFFILLGLLLISLSFIGGSPFDDSYTEKEVKCYDRFGNEIIDQVCLDKQLESEFQLGLFILGFMFFFFGGLFLIAFWPILKNTCTFEVEQ